MSRNRLLATIASCFAGWFILGGSTVAEACSCRLLSAHDKYRGADAVFVGKAVSKALVGGGIRFEIEESFWGTNGDSIVVRHYDPIQCDSFSFRVGQRYLVVAYKRGHELTAGVCNQGAGIKLATGDIHVLRLQKQGKPLPQVYGVLTDKFGNPLGNATIMLRDEFNRAKPTLQARTAEDGYFEFKMIPEGDYAVEAVPENGKTPIKNSFTTRFNGTRMIMHGW